MAWIVGAVVGVGALALGAQMLLQRSKQERQAREDAEFASAPVQEASALAQAWRTDAVGFDARHKGHVLAVTGEVERVESVEGAFGAGTNRAVILRTGESLEISCWFGAEGVGAVAGWTKGTRVTIAGRWAGEGRSSQEVVLRFCRPR